MNIKRSIVVLILLLVATKSFSQGAAFSVPNYEAIKKEIQNKDSKFNYKKQLQRLQNCDTTLTGEEYRYLYFGYVFQPEYNPYSRSADEEALSKYYQSETIDAKDYPEIIRLATHSISVDPFDLRQMNFLSYIYHLSGDEVMAKKIAAKFRGIFEAILSSGDGKTCETGFHVLTVGHEYVFLNVFELQSVSQSLVDHCDYLKFEKGKYKIDGIYFDITQMQKKEMEVISGK